jgi:hypothetical protein
LRVLCVLASLREILQVAVPRQWTIKWRIRLKKHDLWLPRYQKPC